MLVFPADHWRTDMYNHFFRLKQAPFSIAPDPRYLFLTSGHREALAHLLYGINSGGGLVLLTGEIGAGKTTVCRYFLEQVPPKCNVAYIFNPKQTVPELLQSICDEFRIPVTQHARTGPTTKDHVDALTRYLLVTHADGQNNVLIIDEAQNLSPDVLEQLRLLTNLETNERKLLQIVLIGQPELRAMLDRPELQQLAQRVIARFHLKALTEQETASYIRHRLAVAGLGTTEPFGPQVIKQIHQLTRGVPRRINVLCDRALLGAFAEDKRVVNHAIVGKAASEVFGHAVATFVPDKERRPRTLRVAAMTAFIAAATLVWTVAWHADSRFFRSTFARTQPDSTPSSVAQIQTAPAPVTHSAGEARGPAPAAPILSETDGSLVNGYASIDEAYQQLGTLWGAALPETDPCEAARVHQLHCYASSRGFAELRMLDRPAILRMRDNANRTYHVILTGLSDTGAALRVRDATQTLNLVVLARYFDGDFATLWRAPGTRSTQDGTIDKDRDAGWVAAQLARIDGEEPTGDAQRFDERMGRRVRQFQLTQGLKADGLVGPLTYMHLNRVAGVDEPQLRKNVTAIRAGAME
ncbi:MAG: peptidoglycan-binding protein [Noviherbaspirillum sp.]|nr:peptidoglycan-binding protein [Noviherbaspirillum sp.]